MSTHKCTQAGCAVEKDGKCLEGFETTEMCTYYNAFKEGEEAKHNEQSDTPIEEEFQEKKEEEFFNVYSGNPLTIVECDEIARKGSCNLIILAGHAEAGKTTLLASINQLLQQSDSFAGFLFNGSKTLIGLEKRSHQSRMTSEGEKEDTERTKLKSAGESHDFLHLSLVQGDKQPIDFLITDISGEYFKLLTNSTQECKNFTLMKRCDHFCLFFDVNLLSTDSEKNALKTSTINILRSLKDANMLQPETNIQVLFSKYDLLQSKDNIGKHKEFIQSIVEEIKQKFAKENTHIDFLEIASRPSEQSDLGIGYGLENLIRIWYNNSKFSHKNNTNTLVKSNSSYREVEKFQWQEGYHE